ncbi:MAG: hypothetical protein LBK07_05540 [Tannerella sp.]|jgi:hypothetical protein|nr:hypothetical protein [Tannerella sp.]
MEQKKQSRKKKKSWLSSVLYFFSGGILKEEFVVKHTRMIVLVAFMLMFFIGNRFICLLKLREIERLEEELRDAKNQNIAILSELTGSNRLSEIEDIVKRQELGLESAQTPPYILYK